MKKNRSKQFKVTKPKSNTMIVHDNYTPEGVRQRVRYDIGLDNAPVGRAFEFLPQDPLFNLTKSITASFNRSNKDKKCSHYVKKNAKGVVISHIIYRYY